jgi:hypothetical protein
MTKDAVASLSAALTAEDASVVRAHVEAFHSFDKPAQGKDLPDARKLAILQELARRKYVRTRRAQLAAGAHPEHWPAPYVEEWGMAIALGTLLAVGNYDASRPMDENAILGRRLTSAARIVGTMMHYAKPATPPVFEARPAQLTNKRVITSGRRLEDLFRQWIAAGHESDRRDAEMVRRITQLAILGNGYTPDETFHTTNIRGPQSEAEPRLWDKRHAGRVIGAAATSANSLYKYDSIAATLRHFGVEPNDLFQSDQDRLSRLR